MFGFHYRIQLKKVKKTIRQELNEQGAANLIPIFQHSFFQSPEPLNNFLDVYLLILLKCLLSIIYLWFL